MSWFWIALAAPIIYALVNQTDKYFISRHFKEGGGVGAMIIVSSVFNILALPVIYWLAKGAVSLVPLEELALAVNGMFTIAAIILYLYALQKEEASVVTPFFQTVPILTFVLGYFVLGETLSVIEALGCFLVVAGTMILSFDLKASGKFKWRLVFLMLASALALAINAVIFKLIAVDAGFLASIFWDFTGKTILGLILFILVGSYRREFMTLAIDRPVIFFWILVTQVITIVGDFIASYAVLLAPVAIVSAILGLQPLFVFIYGIILTLLAPWFVEESLDRKELAQKITAIAVIIIGGWLIGG